MSVELAGPARIVRPSEGWTPVGPVLPPIDDDRMHHRTVVEGRTIYWHFPVVVGAEPGDVLLAREQMILLRDRCGPNHRAVRDLADYYGVEVADLLAERDVWSARVLTRAEMEALR